MKKLFALFLVCFSLLGLAACEGFDINGLLGGLPGNTAVATQEQLDEAAEMLYVYNKPGENNQLASDLQRLSILDYDGVIFSVKWEVEGAGDNVVIVENDDDTVTIDVNKYIDHDADVTIKATLTSGTLSKTVEFHYVMKKFVLSTWEQWFDENKQSTGTITIKGVIVAKDVYSAANKNTSLYIEDLDGMGGYMAYRVVCSTQAAYDTDLAIGNIVEITGTASPFNGFREFKAGCTYEVLEGTQTVAPHALDEVIAASSDLKKDLDPYQSMLVSLEGWKVKSVAVQTEFNKETNSGSVNVVLTKGGKEITTRFSTSNTFTYDDVEAAYAKLEIGYVVNVTGVVAWYNTPQIYPLNADSYVVTSTEVTPEEVIDGAKAELLKELEDKVNTNFGEGFMQNFKDSLYNYLVSNPDAAYKDFAKLVSTDSIWNEELFKPYSTISFDENSQTEYEHFVDHVIPAPLDSLFQTLSFEDLIDDGKGNLSISYSRSYLINAQLKCLDTKGIAGLTKLTEITLN